MGKLGAAAAILAAGHWKPTPSNIRGLNAWIACEKGSSPWEHNNPLNTTNSVGKTYDWGTQGNIAGYPSARVGAKANANTIKGLDGMAGWPAIEAALKRGNLASAFVSSRGGIISNWGTSPSCIVSQLGSASPVSKNASPGASTGTASASTSGGCSCAGWNAWNPLCRIGQGVCSVKEGVLGEFAVVGRWLEAGAGGAIMIVGLGVMIFGVTGRNAGPVVGAAIKATGPVGMAASSASSDPVGAQRTTPDTAAGSRSKARAAAATKPRPKPRPAPRTGHETIDTKTPAGKARARRVLAEEAR